MATLADLLETSVYNKAHGNSTLWNSVSGKFKHGKVPSEWTTPYVRYVFPNLPHGNVFKSNSPTKTPVEIYFDIFSNSDCFTEAKTIAGYIETVFNGTSLSMSGYQDMIVKLAAERPIQEEETGLWHYQLVYRGTACVS